MKECHYVGPDAWAPCEQDGCDCKSCGYCWDEDDFIQDDEETQVTVPAEEETMQKFERITIDELIRRMRMMNTGDIISLVRTVINDDEALDWYGIKLVDMDEIDPEHGIWVLAYYGGSGNPSVFSSYGYYEYEKRFKTDILKALKDKNLLQEDETVFVHMEQ